MIVSGFSERGLSDVTTTSSASCGGDAAHDGALGLVAVAAAAEDDVDAPAAGRASGRTVFRTPSRAAGLCA